MTTEYPVTYAKGDQRRLAHTAADAVKHRFDGFQPVEADTPAPAPEKAEDKPEDESSSGAQPPESGDKSVDTVGTVAPKPGPNFGRNGTR